MVYEFPGAALLTVSTTWHSGLLLQDDCWLAAPLHLLNSSPPDPEVVNELVSSCSFLGHRKTTLHWLPE